MRKWIASALETIQGQVPCKTYLPRPCLTPSPSAPPLLTPLCFSPLSPPLTFAARQVDVYEAELEQINSAKKKKKDSGAQKWEDLLERCRYHEERLELVLRLIDNESLSPEDVDNIKDQLDYLLEQVLNSHPQNEWSQVAPFLPQNEQSLLRPPSKSSISCVCPSIFIERVV